jgi:hypothetical protein
MPVLAKEAIETAGLIEDGEVFVAVFRAGFVGIARKTRARPPGQTKSATQFVGRLS